MSAVRSPVVPGSSRCAAEIRADIALSMRTALDAASAWSDEELDAADRLTDAEIAAAHRADAMRERSRWACDLRTGLRRRVEPVQAPGWALEWPSLSEPACVVLGALAEFGGAVSWLEVAVRLGANPAAVERHHEPEMHAAFDELVRVRLAWRIADGRVAGEVRR